MGNVIAIDLGGTNLRIGLVDESNNLLDKAIIKTKVLIESESPVLKLIEIIKDFHIGEADAISIGLPSTIDKNREVVLSTPNIPQLNNLALKSLLEEGTGLKAYIEKDSNCLLYYDMMRNNLPKDGLTCGIYFGTGIGFSMIYKGSVMPGKNGVLGEIGHIPIIGDEKVCGCGKKGCLEETAGGKNLVRIKEEFFPNTDISDLFVRHADDSQIMKFIESLSVCLVMVENILDPDNLVIGGGIVNMEGFPYSTLLEFLQNKVREPYPRNNMNIVRAIQDDSFNGVIGAAIFARNNKENMIKKD